jgi:hypothetical protein
VTYWDDSKNEKPIYDCYAVSNHYGGLGGGHYTAYALNSDDKWCHYDDSRITTDVDPKEVVSSAAYVLYYKRRDVIFETPDFESPMPAIVQDHFEGTSVEDESPTNLVRVESMDLENPVSRPSSSNTSTSVMADEDAINPQDPDADDFLKAEYDSDHLPIQDI